MTFTTLLIRLASEGVTDKTWWNPYVKGGLVTVMAIGLFVGAGYLLLYTNVGTRLGFLLTAAAFSGFMAVLSVFWITGQFPNGPLGQEPGWPVQEIVPDPSQSDIDEVRDIQSEGTEAESAEAGQITAGLEEQLTNTESEFKTFDSAGDFLVRQTITEGGGRKWPFWWSEETTYGAAELCETAHVETLPLDAPPPPECDEGRPTQWAIVVKDLGARRLPAWFFFGGSSLLFALSLVSLHRYEIDQRQPEAEEGGSDGEGDGGEGPEPGGNGQRAPDSAPTPEPADA